MPTIPELFQLMPERYRKGVIRSATTYYFSIGPHKYTATLRPDGAEVKPGQTVARADVVLKATEELFVRMVVEGKLPGPLDIARGRIRTNDPAALRQLRDLFDFSR